MFVPKNTNNKMIPLYYTTKPSAIIGAYKLCREQRRTIYVYAVRYGEEEDVEYALKNDDQIMDTNSENIIYTEHYQPGKEK